jgi:hypothetical protein
LSTLLYIANTAATVTRRTKPVPSDWVDPDQVHAFITELLQPIGTYPMAGDSRDDGLLGWGRWRAIHPNAALARIWQKPRRSTLHRTLTGATPRNMHVERDFDFEAMWKLKRQSEHDISIGGAELARLALEADLVDECPPGLRGPCTSTLYSTRGSFHSSG